MTQRVPMIVDCDPGHDDAMAILLATRYADLRAITTVGGNAGLAYTTRNAIISADYFGFTGPIHSGAPLPFATEPKHAPAIHGESGLDGPDLPAPSREVDSTDAAGFLIEYTKQHEGVWLVPTCPLTNIALALRRDPSMVDRIAGISLMGGGLNFGNWSATAEFNIWFDPESAWVVFHSGAPIKMCGLNLTHQFLVTPDYIDSIAAIGGRVATFVAEVLTFFSKAYENHYFGNRTGPLHDPCAVLALTHPGLIQFSDYHVDIELNGTLTRGMTVVDQRRIKSVKPANTSVAMSIDAPAGFELIRQAIVDLS
jgi:inosine-uridine nucleoside N-ribohydrolase